VFPTKTLPLHSSFQSSDYIPYIGIQLMIVFIAAAAAAVDLVMSLWFAAQISEHFPLNKARWLITKELSSP
jgi:hypothetical protein